MADLSITELRYLRDQFADIAVLKTNDAEAAAAVEVLAHRKPNTTAAIDDDAPEIKMVNDQYIAGPPPDGRSIEEHLAELVQGKALPLVCSRRCRGKHDTECLREAARRFAESAGNESEEDASLSVLRERLNAPSLSAGQAALGDTEVYELRGSLRRLGEFARGVAADAGRLSLEGAQATRIVLATVDRMAREALAESDKRRERNAPQEKPPAPVDPDFARSVRAAVGEIYSVRNRLMEFVAPALGAKSTARRVLQREIDRLAHIGRWQLETPMLAAADKAASTHSAPETPASVAEPAPAEVLGEKQADPAPILLRLVESVTHVICPHCRVSQVVERGTRQVGPWFRKHARASGKCEGSKQPLSVAFGFAWVRNWRPSPADGSSSK